VKRSKSKGGASPSELITGCIEELGDWRGERLARVRKLILAADPGLTEAWKWGCPVWYAEGNVVSAGAFKDHVKINFFRGASLKDPKGLFNAGLDAKATRAIDLREDDELDATALKALVRAAAALDRSGSGKR
jgi:hypothetical protein